MCAKKNTTLILKNLREVMKKNAFINDQIHAYIVSHGDAHQSEYIAPSDSRREFVSGFSGSAGTAVITDSKAALWTDGRYYLQAEKQLDSNWTLMRDGLIDTPTLADWLNDTLTLGSRVGADPLLLSTETWKSISKKLEASGNALVAIQKNLIDIVWDEKPDQPCNPLLVLDVKYTGKTWQQKVKDVRERMNSKKAKVLIVTALDEIAWLLNLRGSDINFNPVFFSYLIIGPKFVYLFIDEQKLSPEVLLHLEVNKTDAEVPLKVQPYIEVKFVIDEQIENTSGKIWISHKSSWALVNSVPKNRRIDDLTPIALMKAIKNETEINCMKRAHVKDAVALCEYFMWLEKEIHKGYLTEVSAADYLEKLRAAQEGYVSLSFDTISSSGPNGAVIHYKPIPGADRLLTPEEMYLCDSGAQYIDGTTDVTRSQHFGNPSDFEKECFTRVMKGEILLGSAIFPNKLKGHLLDSFARYSLWQVGLDYLHGTGHGVGSFLNVHEGPCSISYKTSPTEAPLEEGMILSNEPGYYEDGKFGVRHENLALVVKADTKYNFNNRGYLTFEMITLVPFQASMIIPDMLTEKEIKWINDYHTKVRTVVGEELKKQGKLDVYDWLVTNTELLG